MKKIITALGLDKLSHQIIAIGAVFVLAVAVVLVATMLGAGSTGGGGEGGGSAPSQSRTLTTNPANQFL